MDWITKSVAIGNFVDSRNGELLRAEGIRSVVSLDGSLRDYDRSGLPYEDIAHFDLIDGPGNDPRVFLFALRELERLHEETPPVLVHCHAGRSRSVVLVTAFLARNLDVSIDEALEQVTSRREAALTPGIESLFAHVE